MSNFKAWLLGRFKGIRQIGKHLLAIVRNPVFLLALGAVLIFTFLWEVPRWKVSTFKDSLTSQECIQLENETLRSWAQVFGIFGGIALLFLTWRRIEVAQEGQITERFTRAIDQLGATHQDGKRKIMEIRLGGIYALERIARDSKRDHMPVMEVLTAYVRENAPMVGNGKQREQQRQSEEGKYKGTVLAMDTLGLDADIQAILTVLGRRKVKNERGERRALDLNKTNLAKAELHEALLGYAHFFEADLREAKLVNADLHEAYLRGAVLQGAVLQGANIQGAYLEGANLQGANLWWANLQRAFLMNADLHEANLWKTNLRGAYLEGANLQGAFLMDADLTATSKLTVKQLSKSKTLFHTQLPPELKDQLSKGYPHLFEKPKDVLFIP